MSKENNMKLNPAEIKAIENVVSKGGKVEVMSAKEGIKIMQVNRKEVKTKCNENKEIQK